MGRTLPLLLVLLASLLLAAGAEGATRYATPGGDASDPTCPQNDPCDIRTAVQDPSVDSGDRIEVAPGTHNIGSNQLTIGKSVNIVGVGGRPEIRSSHQEATVRQFGGFPTLENLEITNVSGSGTSLRAGLIMGDSRIRRVEASGNHYGCWLEGDADLFDSICIGSNTFPGISVRPPDAAGVSVELTNVTAVAFSGFEIPALEAVKGVGDGDIVVQVDNSILQGAENTGSTVDVRADNQAGSGSVEVIARNSNYSFRGATATGGGTATITAPSSNYSQSAEPAFVSEIGANYHQAPSSPTVDAGNALAGISGLDIDEDDRNQGATVDIGADELDVVPTLEFTQAPAEGSVINDKTPTFAWTSDEDDVSFKCFRPGVSVLNCTSPRTIGTGFSPSLADGEHTFTVRGTDTAGNTPEIARTFTVDTVAPETSIDSGPSGETTDTTPTFGFGADEAGVSFRCAIDGTTAGPCSGPGATHTPDAPLGLGQHQLAVVATDPAGNVGLAQTREFTVVAPPSDPADPADPGGPGDPTDPGDPSDPGADITPPTLALKGKRKQSSPKKVKLRATCDEACTVVVRPKGKAKIAGVGASAAAKKKLKLKPARAGLSAGETKTLKLKFKGKKTKRLVKRGLRRGKKVKLKLKGRATDEAGNRDTDGFKVKLKR